jgi:hypothetical protein
MHTPPDLGADRNLRTTSDFTGKITAQPTGATRASTAESTSSLPVRSPLHVSVPRGPRDLELPAPSTPSTALQVNRLDNRFQLRVSLRVSDRNGGHKWINRGSIYVGGYEDSPQLAYDNIQSTLANHIPHGDTNRPFYIWPGRERNVPISCPLTLVTHLDTLTDVGWTWAHLSVALGLSRHLDIAEGGRFTNPQQNDRKRSPSPVQCERPTKKQQSLVDARTNTTHDENAVTNHAEDDSSHAEDDSSHAEDDSSSAEDDSSSANDDSSNAIDESSHAEDDFSNVKDDINFELAPINPHGATPSIAGDSDLSDDVLEAVRHIPDPRDSDEESSADDEEQDEKNSASSRQKPQKKCHLTAAEADLAAKLREEVVDRTTAKRMERIDAEDWLKASRFWGVSDSDFRAGNAISLDTSFWGLKVHVTPAQLHEAYSLYLQELSDWNGGILANMMGMGKTRTMWLMIVLGHAHLVNFLDVADDRASGDGKSRHLPSSALTGSIYPSAPSRPFPCSCQPDSVFQKAPPRLAPTFLSGGGKSVYAWVAEFEEWLMGSKWCDPSMTNPALRVCWLPGQQLLPARTLTRQQLALPTPLETSEMRCQVDLDGALARKNLSRESLKRTFRKNGKYCDEYPTWSWASDGVPPLNHPDATNSHPAPSSGRFILLSNFMGITKHYHRMSKPYKCFLVRVITQNGHPTKEKHTTNVGANLFVAGRTIFDEFHLAKNPETMMCKVYQTLQKTGNQGYQFKSWAISGTPMEAGLAEVLTFFSLALPGIPTSESPHGNWKDSYGNFKNDMFKQIANAEVDAAPLKAPGLVLANKWKSKVRAATTMEAAQSLRKSDTWTELMEFGKKFMPEPVLWRTWLTRDPWGKRLGGLDTKFITNFKPCHLVANTEGRGYDYTIATALQRIRRSPEAGPKFSFQHAQLSAFASFPYLAVAMAQVQENHGPSTVATLNADAVTRLAKTATPYTLTDSPFLPYLDKIVRSSAKFGAVMAECQRVLQERNSQVRDNGQARSKILIGSCRPICQLMLYMGLSEYFSAENVTFLPGGIPRPESTSRADEWRKPDGPWILVVSVNAYAESVNFIEAQTVILLEPQDRVNRQDQFACRIFRKGQ